MAFRWMIQSAVLPEGFKGGLGVSGVLGGCLASRGMTDPVEVERFLDPRLQHLRDPFDFPGMDEVVRRLHEARARGERVVLFGDYDADGVTATALLAEVLGSLGWHVRCHIPDRFTDGYGLSQASVERCLGRHPCELMLAVDCGATARELVRSFRGRGVEILVLDHHVARPDELPEGGCLHPGTLLGADDPARGLCSVGLAFKLAHGLVKRGRLLGMEAESRYDIRLLLDLVALGTVADLATLSGENRILVTAGLRVLERTRRPGLRALMAMAGVRGRPRCYELAFQLAPRLNASGRLETAEVALDLLMEGEEERAQGLAEVLDRQNRERQSLERSISEEVVGRIRGSFKPDRDYVLVVGDSGWHVGVVGIVASRVAKEFNRPAIVLGGDGGVLRGSGRSVGGFDLAAALGGCGDLIERGGGHAMAAGLSLRSERLEAFRERMNGLARSQFGGSFPSPDLRLDGRLLLGAMRLEVVAELERLEPTGQGNPPARFAFLGVRLAGVPRRMGREGMHVRFTVTDGCSTGEVVWWRGGVEPWPEGIFDLAAEPGLNEFNGRTSVQLKLLDWRRSEGVEGGGFP